ncbi:hypothetical protein JF544_06735 [Halobacillus kuroshimensis]|uniref:Uncharacterized protein n=1 Tax=Halobacillus kuroshimensis TaxID=302481 RepID=A0ABS3DUN7_9BACI|nr:hypothetical protein [Halobacillus kuroshimensis]
MKNWKRVFSVLKRNAGTKITALLHKSEAGLFYLCPGPPNMLCFYHIMVERKGFFEENQLLSVPAFPDDMESRFSESLQCLRFQIEGNALSGGAAFLWFALYEIRGKTSGKRFFCPNETN